MGTPAGVAAWTRMRVPRLPRSPPRTESMQLSMHLRGAILTVNVRLRCGGVRDDRLPLARRLEFAGPRVRTRFRSTPEWLPLQWYVPQRPARSLPGRRETERTCCV